MRRPLAMIALMLAVLLGVSACGENGIDGSNVSEVAGQVQDAAGELRSEINGGGGLLPTEPQPPEPPPEPPPSPEPAPAEQTGIDPLVWVLLAAAALVLLLIVIISSAARRRRDAAHQRQRLRDDALLEVDWLLDTAYEQPSQVDAAARARDIRVRMDRAADTLRRLEAVGDRRVAEAADELRAAATSLARSVIARLDDVAAGRSATTELDVDALIERARLARDRFIEVT